MATLIEFLVDQVWDEYVYRIYKRSGWKWAAVAILGPLFVVATVIGLFVLALS